MLFVIRISINPVPFAFSPRGMGAWSRSCDRPVLAIACQCEGEREHAHIQHLLGDEDAERALVAELRQAQLLWHVFDLGKPGAAWLLALSSSAVLA